jgi:alpha-L-fucosidase
MLRRASAGQGNLLLNVGPRGDGSLPEEGCAVLDRAGAWLKANGEAIFATERFDYGMQERGGRSDWTHHGAFTAGPRSFYLHVISWPGPMLAIGGVQSAVVSVDRLDTGEQFKFEQNPDRLVVTGLPASADTTLPVVLRFRTRERPCIYGCGGHRVPEVPHCRYDPLPSDVKH